MCVSNSMFVHDRDSYIGQRVYGSVCVWTAACSTSLFDYCDAYVCIGVYIYIYISVCQCCQCSTSPGRGQLYRSESV